jgi:hypothetical protein
MICLLLGWMVVAVLPFRHVGRLASIAPRRQAPAPDVQVATVKRISWAVAACARRVPWRALCFEQGLAAQAMLRRRGIPASLYYGAALDDRRDLSAHVWVRVGEADVIGCENASRYAVLATFPSAENPMNSAKVYGSESDLPVRLPRGR